MTTKFDKLNTDHIYGNYYKYLDSDVNFSIIFRMTDGYVNATKLCAMGVTRRGLSKRFCDWKGLYCEEVYREVSDTYGIPLEKLTELVQAGQRVDISGTYVHPKLVTHIASWISPRFAVRVDSMLDAWRAQTPNNEQMYWKNMVQCLAQPSMCDSDDEREADISDFLAQERNGKREVVTPVGNIDVLTETELIEVKRIHLWKHAMGQVLAYGRFYPNHVKKIYLYNDRNVIFDDNIRLTCNDYGVIVELHDMVI